MGFGVVTVACAPAPVDLTVGSVPLWPLCAVVAAVVELAPAPAAVEACA